MIFQQNGTTCYIKIREIIQLLHKSFPDYVISRFTQNWSSDLTPISLDFLKFKTNPRLFIFEGKN